VVGAKAGILLATLAATGLFAGRAAADGNDAQSTNWGGYVVADAATIDGDTTSAATSTFTSVTGTWKQPKVSCRAGSATYSAFWVGLGGFASDSAALEQIGTSADCPLSGRPRYSAWYELVPAGPVPLRLTIAPGDTVTASVNAKPDGILVQIKNRTKGTSFTKLLPMTSPDLTSAEWIAEAPSQCDRFSDCSTLPLASFGKISFTRLAAIASGHPGTVIDPAWTAVPVDLVPDVLGGRFDRNGSSTATATPRSLTADGRAFDVFWAPS
jgi:hypothetical protein